MQKNKCEMSSIQLTKRINKRRESNFWAFILKFHKVCLSIRSNISNAWHYTKHVEHVMSTRQKDGCNHTRLSLKWTKQCGRHQTITETVQKIWDQWTEPKLGLTLESKTKENGLWSLKQQMIKPHKDEAQ